MIGQEVFKEVELVQTDKVVEINILEKTQMVLSDQIEIASVEGFGDQILEFSSLQSLSSNSGTELDFILRLDLARRLGLSRLVESAESLLDVLLVELVEQFLFLGLILLSLKVEQIELELKFLAIGIDFSIFFKLDFVIIIEFLHLYNSAMLLPHLRKEGCSFRSRL